MTAVLWAPLATGSFPQLPQGGGLIPLNFHTTPPALGGKEREGKGKDGKGRRKENGRKGTPKGLVDTTHVPNPEKYPAWRVHCILLRC